MNEIKITVNDAKIGHEIIKIMEARGYRLKDMKRGKDFESVMIFEAIRE